MKKKELDKIIESLLFASSDPLSQTLLNQGNGRAGQHASIS